MQNFAEEKCLNLLEGVKLSQQEGASNFLNNFNGET